jgi:V8-like Glu-specific endopeptidase
MHQRNRLLVIAHSIGLPIGGDEIEEALDPVDVERGYDLVEIVPERINISDFYKINWADLEAKQEQQVLERLLPAMTNRRRIAYFGFGPLPTAVHLGRKLYGYKVDVYQRHHKTHEWTFAKTENAASGAIMKPIAGPEQGSSDPGDLILRVSITHRIASLATRSVVPNPLGEVDVVVQKPSDDVLATKEAFDEALASVQEAWRELHRLFPRAGTLHIFFAGPLGLAFQIGATLNPTIFPKVQTYQYHSSSSPQYIPAIILGGQTEAERWMTSANDASEARSAHSSPIKWAGKELVTGKQPSFYEIAFLEKGLKASRSVVLLRVLYEPGKQGNGTGFLIAPNTILTNHHVLYSNDKPAQKVLIWFNYERDVAGNECAVEQCEGNVTSIVGDEHHDWAVIGLKAPPRQTYEPLTLGAKKPLVEEDFVYIVQHPNGELKKIGMTHNQVVSVTDDCVQYLTDTLPGSSGAPVFNDSWHVVALHREGLEGQPEDKHPFKNQGTFIDRVIEGLKAAKILGSD